MKNYNLLSMLILGTVLFGSWGCAKDKTVAEYDNAQAAKQAAQNLPAVALWVGPVTDSDGSTVGMIQLNLENQFITLNANDNTTAQQVVLRGQAELTNVPNSDADVADANFNPDGDDSSNGTLAVTITGKDANLNPQTLSITATISGNTMTGQVQAGADTPLTFIATKGASSTSQNLVANSKRTQFDNGSYFSTQSPVEVSGDLCETVSAPVDAPQECVGPCPSPSPVPSSSPTAVSTCGSNIEMAIIENNSDGAVNFYNALTDHPTVQVDINYYVPYLPNGNESSDVKKKLTTDGKFSDYHLQFFAVTWDLNSKKLTASNNTATGGTNRLDCSAQSTATGIGWSCDITDGGVVSPGVILAPGHLPSGSN